MYEKYTFHLYIKQISDGSSDEIQIQDYYGYKSTGSATFSSSTTSYQTIFDLNGIGDCEITYEMSATVNRGFSIRLENDNTNNYISPQVDGAGYFGSYTKLNSSQQYTLYDSQYTANNWFSVTIRRVSGAITIIHNNKTHTDSRDFSNFRYLTVDNWNSAKTVNYRNLIVKKL